MERDWLDVESDDDFDVSGGWMGAGGLNRDDAIAALEDAIIRLADGEDVSPQMRKMIALAIGSGDVRLARSRESRGNKSFPERDKVIAEIFEDEVLRAGGKRTAAYQAVADIFGVDPRSIGRAIERDKRRGDTETD